jgi:hypothetical protein
MEEPLLPAPLGFWQVSLSVQGFKPDIVPVQADRTVAS